MSYSEIFFPKIVFSSNQWVVRKKIFLLPTMVATFHKHYSNFPFPRKRPSSFNFLANALQTWMAEWILAISLWEIIFLEPNKCHCCPHIETRQLILSANQLAGFYLRATLTLNVFTQKDSSAHMHDLTVHVKEGLPFTWDLSLENSADSYLYFRLALLQSMSYFFFLYWSPLSLCTVFDSISSNIDEVLSINPSANVFIYGDLKSIIRTGLPILMKLIYLVNSVIIYSISIDLTQMVNFPTQIPDCDSHSPGHFDLFISSDASICFTMVFPPLGNYDHVVLSASIDFPTNSQQDAPLHQIAYDYSRAD